MARQLSYAIARLRSLGLGVNISTVAICYVAAVAIGIAVFAKLEVSGVFFAGSASLNRWFLAFCAILFVLSCATAALGWSAFQQRKTWQNERRKLVEAHQSGFDSASDAIVVLDVGGRIETLNRAAEKMFGRTRDVLKDLDVSALLDMASSDGPVPERLKTTSDDLNVGIHRELVGKRDGSETFPVDVTFRELLQPGARQVVAFVRDISDRKRVERLKDEFVSTVNHELRTPLTSIAGSLGLLAGGAAGELPPGAARLIGIAHANCQRLIRLINDVLDVEKIESGKMRFDLAPQRLAEITHRAVESLQGYADQLGVGIAYREDGAPLDVHADADRVVQVITNLISNALKFSAVGGQIVVATERAGRVARFSVKDDGPGIPDEFRSRIFTKFAQANSSDTRQKGGTGLGLVIAKEITERHGGRLWFESEPGKGARFFVDLPLMEHKAASEASSDANGDVILICEDDRDLAAVLREILERDGLTVEHVATKRDALRTLKQSPGRYVALLLDLVLPDGDGVELIRELRADASNRELPIVVISAEADRGRKEIGAHALNVVDWMDKPVDIIRLKAVVQSVVSSTAGAKPVILHVEDDADLLELTASVLGGCGQILSAESLKAARAALARRRPDLVILDLGLKDGSGLDLLPDLRDGEGRLIPVVVFSARDADRSVMNQVKAVMTKSRTPLPELADMVKSLLEEHQPKSAPKKKIAV